MTRMLRAAFLAVLLSISIPEAAGAQQATIDSLRCRADVLERTTADLERRVRELEAIIKGEPSRERSIVPASANAREIQNWRRLRRGMTMDEVRTLLGEPEKVDAGPYMTYWYWDYPGGAEVSFNSRSGKLEGWSEPRR